MSAALVLVVMLAMFANGLWWGLHLGKALKRGEIVRGLDACLRSGKLLVLVRDDESKPWVREDGGFLVADVLRPEERVH